MNSSRLLHTATAQRSVLSSTVRHHHRVGITASRLHSYSRFSRTQPTLLLLARRSLTTETSTTSGGAAGPPPGFNVEEAKKPLQVAEKPKAPLSPIEKAAEELRIAKELEEKKAKGKDAGKEIATASGEKEKGVGGSGKKEEKKVTVWQKVKHGVQHFWDGTKLLGVEIKISWKLAVKMAAGYELSRRERRQLERTVKDLGRLVPFSVFIIVPAGELFLPVALKFFPNLLPSTYEDQKQKDMKLQKLRTTRKDVSDFIRKTLREGGLPLSAKTRNSEEFTQFFKKIRTTGLQPSREELIKVCKTFKDDVTLDNLSRPQLVGMCRYMNLNSFGTDAMLRYSVRHRMRQIKRDDRQISFEGIDTLSVAELQHACASRGIRTHGVSPARLREDLATWLELRLKHGLPSTLMVLSNAFMYAQGKESEADSHYDALQAVLSSIPEELYHEIELEVHSAEGAATNKQRLEVLMEQQELIDEENEQTKEEVEAKNPAPFFDRDIDEKVPISKEAEAKAEGKEKKE